MSSHSIESLGGALDRGDTKPIDDFLRELDAEFGLDVQ